jgi:hypothetical protein
VFVVVVVLFVVSMSMSVSVLMSMTVVMLVLVGVAMTVFVVVAVAMFVFMLVLMGVFGIEILQRVWVGNALQLAVAHVFQLQEFLQQSSGRDCNLRLTVFTDRQSVKFSKYSSPHCARQLPNLLRKH